MVFNLVPGGAGSQYLFERKVGDQLTFTGPFGLFTLDRAPDTETISRRKAPQSRQSGR